VTARFIVFLPLYNAPQPHSQDNRTNRNGGIN